MTVIEELYARHYRPLCQYALSLCGDVAQSQDLVQDAFTAAVQKETPVKVSWLYTVIRYKAIDARRKRKPELLEDTALLPDVSAFNLARPELGEIKASIDDAVKELPSKLRDAFVLYARGVSVDEMGELLAVPAKTAQTWVFRARMKLQDALQNHNPRYS